MRLWLKSHDSGAMWLSQKRGAFLYQTFLQASCKYKTNGRKEKQVTRPFLCHNFQYDKQVKAKQEQKIKAAKL